MIKFQLNLRAGGLSPTQQSSTSRFSGITKSFSETRLASCYSARIKSKNLDLEDQKSVRELDIWDRAKYKYSSLEKIYATKDLLHRRLNNETRIETIIDSRRQEKTLRPAEFLPFSVSSPFSTSSPKLSEIRKQETLKFKERSRFYRLYEDDLSGMYQEIEEHLREINSKRENLRKEVTEIRKEIKENHDNLSSLRKNLKYISKQKDLQGVKSQHEIARAFSRRKTIREEIDKKEMNFQEQSEDFARAISTRHVLIESLDAEYSHLKQELQVIRDEQIKHFFTLLLEGKDTKFEGLSWIIKILWGYGQKISISCFPTFLDEKSINAILVLSEKSNELDNLLLKASGISRQDPNKILYVGEKWNGIHTRLAHASKLFRTKKPEVENVKEIKRKLTWVSCNPGLEGFKESQMDDIAEIENQISMLKKEIQQIKEKEITRIYKECCANNYDIKKKTSMKLIFSCIVGYELVEKYKSSLHLVSRENMQRNGKMNTFIKTN